MGAAAADEGCDEASVVSLVSKGPGFGGRCLNDSNMTPQINILNQILPSEENNHL